MKPFLKFFCILSLLVLVLFSCTVQKRLHMPGRHVSWKGGASTLASTGSAGARDEENSRTSHPFIEEESALQTAETDPTAIDETRELSPTQDSVPETLHVEVQPKETKVIEAAKQRAAQESIHHKSERQAAACSKNSMHWFIVLILALGVLSIILLVPGILLIVLLPGIFSLVAGIILLAFGAFLFGLFLYALWIAAVI